MAELKPCPFCGHTPKIERFENRFNRIYFAIECHSTDCDIIPQTAWYADKQEAIEAWNRRATNGTD